MSKNQTKNKKNIDSEYITINIPSRLQLMTALFYTLIGTVSSLVLFLILYWSLRLNSSITSLILNTQSEPIYLWLYGILTFGTIFLFGVNVALLVYRWRTFGFPKLKGQAGTGVGSIVGIAASACPVCGSTLLSVLGITAGLSAFPLGGLELKALSFGLMGLPILLTRREMKKLRCQDDSCPLPKDASYKRTDRSWLLLVSIVMSTLLFLGWNMTASDPVIAKLVSTKTIINPNHNTLNSADALEEGNKMYGEVVAKVLPEKGFQSKIRLSDSITRLVANGVIDAEKFEALYQDRGGLPPELQDVLTKPSDAPILLTRENANYYVNLIWPLGLANYMSSNKESPVNGISLFNFASTGGWNLGKEENGGAYFNTLAIVSLTPEQEELVTKIAKNTYRPCCDNSTFYQDCNHGSALLGLLQLGASQGLTEDELYKEALVFNSFWFPHNYIQTALYFKVKKNLDWEDVNPKEVLGFKYSSLSQWSQQVRAEIAKIPDLLPKEGYGASCGV